MKARFGSEEVQQPRAKKSLSDRVLLPFKQRAFVYDCRRAVEVRSRTQVRESEQRIEQLMKDRFGDEYVPLRHHLMAYQEENIMKQSSKTTPANELSVFNYYVGGENQTKEQMMGIGKRKASKAAEKREPSGDEGSD